MSRQGLAVGVVAVAVFGGAASWRLTPLRRAPPPAHVVFVYGRSASASAGCEGLQHVAGSVFDLPGIVPRSTASLVVTGDGGNESRGKLVGSLRIPVRRAAMDGLAGAQRQPRAMVDDVVRECRALPASTTSPILSAVRDGLAHLRSLGCGSSSLCYLLVAGDGRENVDAALRNALSGSEKAAQQVRGIVGNEGIRVRFCGFAQTRGTGAGAVSRTRVQLKEKIWKSLFTAPDLVEVSPFCADAGTSLKERGLSEYTAP